MGCVAPQRRGLACETLEPEIAVGRRRFADRWQRETRFLCRDFGPRQAAVLCRQVDRPFFRRVCFRRRRILIRKGADEPETVDGSAWRLREIAEEVFLPCPFNERLRSRVAKQRE